MNNIIQSSSIMGTLMRIGQIVIIIVLLIVLIWMMVKTLDLYAEVYVDTPQPRRARTRTEYTFTETPEFRRQQHRNNVIYRGLEANATPIAFDEMDIVMGDLADITDINIETTADAIGDVIINALLGNFATVIRGGIRGDGGATTPAPDINEIRTQHGHGAAAANEFLNQQRRRTYRTDPENTHDSNVQRKLIELTSKIIVLNQRDMSVYTAEWSDVYNFIKNYSYQGYQGNILDADTDALNLDINRFISDKAKAVRVVEKINAPDGGVMPVIFGWEEQQLHAAVWTRIHSPDNKDKIKNLKESFFYAYVNSIGLPGSVFAGNPVCPAGRSSRCIASIIYLDDAFDESDYPVTKEMIMAEITHKIQKMLNDSLESAGDIIRDKYNAVPPDEDTHPNDYKNHMEELKKFTEPLKCEIEYYIRKEYSSKLNPRDLSTVISNCKAAI
jgi:hypothetical protein